MSKKKTMTLFVVSQPVGNLPTKDVGKYLAKARRKFMKQCPKGVRVIMMPTRGDGPSLAVHELALC